MGVGQVEQRREVVLLGHGIRRQRGGGGGDGEVVVVVQALGNTLIGKVKGT